MESTTMVGVWPPRPVAPSARPSARASASSLFPPAVGPHTTRVFFEPVRPPTDVWSAVMPRPARKRSCRRCTSVEHVRTGGVYTDLHVFAGLGGGLHVDRVPTPRFADGLPIVRAPVPYVDLLVTADLALVVGEGVLLHLPEHLKEASLDHLVRDGVQKAGRLRTLPRRELEDVGRVEAAVLYELEGPPVVVLRLTGMTHYQVGAEGAVRRRLPKDLDLSSIPLSLVAAMHDL